MSFEFYLRLIGMVVFSVVGWRLGLILGGNEPSSFPYVVVLSLAGAALGLLITPWITIRPYRSLWRTLRQVPAQQLLAAVIGLALGLVVAALLALPLSLLPSPLGQVLPVGAAIVTGYLGVAIMVMRQRDLFSLIGGRWPTRGSLGPGDERVIFLDTSVLIDGRIADISKTGFITGALVVPRFVLSELQHIADSPDALRRNRGRRGLEMLNRLQKESVVPVRISDLDVEDVYEVDDKLVMLAKRQRASIMTNDYNLNRVAELQGITVLNINELANAVRAVFLPGEAMQINIIQEGKEPGQGVGYLDDGTMVVVESGKKYLNRTIEVMVTKVLQTAAGRMIFASPTNSH